MDFSLSYKTVETMLLIELIILLLSGSAAYFLRIYLGTRKDIRTKRQEELKEILMTHLSEETELDAATLSSKHKSLDVFIPVVEAIDVNMAGAHWIEMKRRMSQDFLLPIARRDIKKISWLKRSWAVRSLALYHEEQDVEDIIKMVYDPSPLVSFNAAIVAVKMSQPKLIDAVVNVACQESRFSRYAYRDALIDGEVTVWNHLRKRLEEETYPPARIVCMEVLAARQQHDLFDLVKDDLSSENMDLKLSAARVLSASNHPDIMSAFATMMSDDSWQVRCTVAKNLSLHRSAQAFDMLVQLLHDDSWWVRLNAAHALKDLGDEGLQVLRMQDADVHEEAYVMSRYVLGLSK